MINKQLVIIFFLFLLNAVVVLAYAAYPDAERGELLYENHCSTCHEDHVHMRQGSSILTIDEVSAQVERWAKELKLGWNDQDVFDVREYLLSTYYRSSD